VWGGLSWAPGGGAGGGVGGARPPTTAALAAVVYLSLACSAGGYLLLNYGLRFVSAGRVAAFVNVVPVIAVVAAYVVLGERFSAGQAAAAAVVVVGVWITNRRGRAEPLTQG